MSPAEQAKHPPAAEDWLRVGTLEEVQRQEVVVIAGTDRPIAVFAHDGRLSAVDNRCPHMGFPLHRGTVQDGILTCHWHHARFDLCSGCTFDLFADDVQVFEVEVRGDEVYVASRPRPQDPASHYRRRLREGLEQNLGLIRAKAIIALLKAGTDYREIVREIALFGAAYRDGWGGGLTALTALANLVPHLSEETAYLALCQGAGWVARDCTGQPPRRERQPLGTCHIPADTLRRWLQNWTGVRQRDGAERTLLTAVRSGVDPAVLTDLVFSAATERYYADTGHLVDFANKAFEVLDLIGWEHAAAVLPSLMRQLAAARGGEEIDAWRAPIDLLSALRQIEVELPAVMRANAESRAGGDAWVGSRELTPMLLGEDPLESLAALRGALSEGAPPDQLAKILTYAAALRVARFGTANEFGDWLRALHTFSYCSALHQAIKRCPSTEIVRGLFHGAVSVYLDRFLNVPPARLPGEKEPILETRRDPEELLSAFLQGFDRQQNIEAAAQGVARYLQLGHPIQPLFDTLARAAVREDADFHTFQMLEAGIRQYLEWHGSPEAHHILIAVARYLAAHSPTQRSQLQTAQIALRLHRGEALFGEETDARERPG